jgi:hypothetical protein
MPTIYGIITRGYLPKELPPAFTSRVCGNVLVKNPSTLPNELTNRDKRSKNLVHNLLVRGSQRRRLGIPNPTNFFRLARFVVSNWSLLTSITSQSHISITTPTFVRRDRAISSGFAFPYRDERKAHVRSNSRYILKADINRFYHSIYTHTISWAIHSKPIAKARQHDRTLPGNILDGLVRNSQDRQTIGIPIGPDTSFLIAEIILSVNDVILSGQGINNAFRAVDDYEFGCYSLTEAESIRETLQEILGEYELALNFEKTDIIELPVPIEAPIISQLRTYNFSTTNANSQRHQIIHYFDQAFASSQEYPGESVLKYAVSRLSGILVLPANWVLCENLLLQCASVDPSSIAVVLNQLVKYRDLNYTSDTQHIAEVFNNIVKKHAPLRHGSEVAWALWGLILMGSSLNDESATVAANMSDSIVAILMLDAKSKGLVSAGVNFDNFQSYMKTEELYGEQWMLAYEANVKNWLPSLTRIDHVNRDPCFSFLKSNGVFFYDDTISGRIKYTPPKAPIPGEEY